MIVDHNQIEYITTHKTWKEAECTNSSDKNNKITSVLVNNSTHEIGQTMINRL